MSGALIRVPQRKHAVADPRRGAKRDGIHVSEEVDIAERRGERALPRRRDETDVPKRDRSRGDQQRSADAVEPPTAAAHRRASRSTRAIRTPTIQLSRSLIANSTGS